MRHRWFAFALVLLTLSLHPAAGAADVVTTERPLALVDPKIDRPSSSLIVPFYEVDTTDRSGTTTLFAIRNITELTLSNLLVSYLDVDGNSVFQQIFDLEPRATRSFNLRDVPGLTAGTDGRARGAVLISANFLFVEESLAGDFFQVDVGNEFATGERLVRLEDLCLEHETRFLDFGSGTELRIFLVDPRGDSPSDPPSFTVEVIDEAGNVSAPIEVRTHQVALDLEASDFTAESFGTLVFDFRNSQGGYVYAEYSADGLFSVGLNPSCLVPASAAP